ncbi:MAG: DUF3631 domain-containing protein [Actinomycetota bacterium]
MARLAAEADEVEHDDGDLPKADPAPIDPHAEAAEEEGALDRLARLDRLAYDQERGAMAERLGVRVTTLDAEVKNRRSARPRDAGADDDPLGLGWTSDAWPERVDGAAVLDDLAASFARHVVLPAHAGVALALWVVHAWAHNSATISPILAFGSPTMRCGKSRGLALVAALAPRPLAAASVTGPALFRAIEAWRPTILADEIDAAFGPNGDELLRAVLNGSHDRATARVIRCAGEDITPTAFSCWAPIAIAGIGRLPGTVTDRAITVAMQRKRAGERVARLPRDSRGAFLDVRRRLARFAADNFDALRDAEPAMPAGLDDRAHDNWSPMIAIADAVGGAWPSRARAAALALSGERAADDDTAGVALLADVRAIFAEVGSDRIASADLAERLAKLEARPWPEWKAGRPITVRQIARLLAPFAIAPANVRLGPVQGKGYRLDQFDDVFARYLPLLIRPTVPNGGSPPETDDSRSVPWDRVGRIENAEISRKSAPWDGGTDEKGVSQDEDMADAPDDGFEALL